MYQKEIIYMNLFENSEKISCVGYFKMEKKKEQYSMELQVKNIPAILSGKFPIRLQSNNNWKEADVLTIKDGMGKWTGCMDESILKIEIILTDSYRIKGERKNVQHDNENYEIKAAEQYKEKSARGDNVRDDIRNSIKGDEKSDIRNDIRSGIKGDEKGNIRDSIRNEIQDDERSNTRNSTEKNNKINTESEKIADIKDAAGMTNIKDAKGREDIPLFENKWEQLLATYEQIHPYGDNRIYVKLQPKDFVVLRSNYQHLVNNSFLLHGFYNYRYLILGKEKEFYIGVPGVFYEREKMVALMFGFEAFECEGGDAEEGKFGYYLRKVEI